MDEVFYMLERLSAAMWGVPTLLLFLFSAVLFTVKTGFVQFTGIKETARCFFGGADKKENSEVSAFQSVCTSLAASIGTGNIIGVCVALSVGGPGAVFWMCTGAVLGEAIGYAENYIGVLYREADMHGKWCGGAMYTLKNGLKTVCGENVSRFCGILYAVICTFSALGMGNAVQINTAANAMHSAFGVPLWGTGLLCSAVIAVCMYKGRGAIAKLTEKVVPLSCFVFFTACFAVLIKQRHALPGVFTQILVSAFGYKSIGIGFSVSMLRSSLLTGVRRGIFSNEAGLGTSVAVHACVDGVTPHEQGLRSIAEIFIDTVLMCTLTAVCVLSVPDAVAQPPERMFVFALASLFGDAAGRIVCVCLFLFAFSTLVGWSFFGNESIRFVCGRKGERPFAVLYCVIAFAGSMLPFDLAWEFADIVNAMLAILNLSGLLLLSEKIENSKNRMHR